MSLIGYDHAELHRARPKNARRDSGGVAVYYKSHMANYITLIKSTENYYIVVNFIQKNILIAIKIFLFVFATVYTCWI